MKWFVKSVLCLSALFGFNSSWASQPERVVTLGGAVTEIVYALGAGSSLVGADQSSVYPAQAHQLPKVGYYRGFSLEGVLRLNPDLILASEQAGPNETIARLRYLGKRVVIVPSKADLPTLEKRIQLIAEALNRAEAGKVLAAQLVKDVQAHSNKTPGNQRALLLMSHGGTLRAAGHGTAADAVLQLAGLKNVLASQQGYKPLSAESLAALRPDVIITTTMTAKNAGGSAQLLANAGFAQTPAVRNKRVVVLDDLLLLGFGTQLPEALRQLKTVAKP